jgi:hypothetical protein
MSEPKAKPKKKSVRGVCTVLTEQERIVAHYCIKHGTKHGPEIAARELGATVADVRHVMKRPEIQRYIQQYNHAFLKEVARYELSQITKYPVSRDDIIGRLYMLSLTPPEETKGTIDGQVSAMSAIVDLLGLKFSPRDADSFFKDKTPEELRNYALYGKFHVDADASVQPGA